MRRLRAEDGFVGGFEAMPFGFLVFVAGTLLLVNAWAVVDANLAASAAAREAVRTFVESSGERSSATAEATSAAVDALRGQGKDPARMSITWAGGSRRCEAVTATVSYRVRTVLVPWISAFLGTVTTSAHHTEVVDPYRSGLDIDGFTPESCGA